MPNMQNYASTEAKSSGFTLLPKGNYTVQITGIQDKVSNSGIDYTSFCFQIYNGNFKGRYVFSNLYWSEKAAPHSKYAVMRMLEGVGIDASYVDTLTSLDLFNRALLNKPFNVYVNVKSSVGYDDSNDIDYNSIQKLSEIPSATNYQQPAFQPGNFVGNTKPIQQAQPKQAGAFQEDELPF